MENINHLLGKLKNKSYRFSAVRNSILSSLSNNKEPLSVFDLQSMLKESKLSANKTTVYRELNSLKKEGIILEMQLGDNKKMYELANRNHHHHIVCTECGKIKDFVGCGSKSIVNKALKQAPDFAEITSHTFDFFGVCKSCLK